MNICDTKACLRTQMRHKRRMLNIAQKQQSEQTLLDQIHAVLKQYCPDASNIGLYYPMGSEASIIRLLDNMGNHYRFFLPRVIGQDMVFYPFTALDDCEKDDKNILAPKITANTDLLPDVIFVPLLGFTKKGHRLGQGGGFFDRYIHQHRKSIKKTLFIGIGFELQKLDNIPLEPHDEAMDMIITEKTIYQCRR